MPDVLRDLSKAPVAKPIGVDPCIIECRQASGPYTVRCKRCRKWSRRAQTIAGAMGLVFDHRREAGHV